MSRFPPGFLHFTPHDEGSIEPMDPPRFYVRDLPEPYRSLAIANGESWSASIFEDLSAAGVTELEWRQPFRYIEGQLVSEDVYDTMRELVPDQVYSTALLFLHERGKGRRYELLRFRPGVFPPPTDATGPRAKYWLLWDQCVPPVNPDTYATFKHDVELALASWMDRDDYIMTIANGVVTEGFVNRWRSTLISQHLWAQNWEHDFDFVESPAGFHSHRFNITYRWVDAPPPDGIELPPRRD